MTEEKLEQTSSPQETSPAETDVGNRGARRAAKNTTTVSSVQRKFVRPGPVRRAKKYGGPEKASIIQTIEANLSSGASLKDAVQKAGISDQTYYTWKRSSTAVTSEQDSAVVPGDDFSDLIALEQENIRLRRLLLEKLRSENSTLRRKLGMSKGVPAPGMKD